MKTGAFESVGERIRGAPPAADPGRLRDARQPRRSRRHRPGGLAAARRAGRAEIDDLRAWLTTVVGRLALDALGSARAPPRELRRRVAARAGGRGATATTRPSTSRSRPRSSSCSSASPPPSAPPSSSTTSSTSPSTRSPRWSAARPPRCASSPPAPAPTSRPASRASRPAPRRRTADRRRLRPRLAGGRPRGAARRCSTPTR